MELLLYVLPSAAFDVLRLDESRGLEKRLAMLRGMGMLEEFESILLLVTVDDDYALPLQEWVDARFGVL